MSAIDYILPALILMGVVFAFTLGRNIAGGWKGFGRFMVSIPIAGMIAVPLNISIGTFIDPTSHNLAPIEMIVWCGGFFVWFLIVLFFRWITKPTTEASQE